jgi:beta-fructofuranosidase
MFFVVAATASSPSWPDADWLPQFHIRPTPTEARGMNDPCGPVYFNGMYHTFFQDHLPSGTGWGHVVSTDMVHWANMPPALQVDRDFDGLSINTGSVTIVDGVPVAMYNGGILRDGTVKGQSVAMPSNVSDPLLTNWSKPDYNPVIPDSPPSDPCPSFRDDTTAWRSNGEWKLINSGCNAQLLYTSKDFINW